MKRKWKGLMSLLLLLCLTACGGGDSADKTVLRIGEREIGRAEYMVYLYTTSQSFEAAAGEDVWGMDFDGQTADQLVEERTINTLQSVIAAEDYATANGISLTEEEKAQAELAAEQFFAGVSEEDLKKIQVEEEELAKLMEASYLYTLVHQSIAEECQVDAGETEAYYQENKDILQTEYTTLHVQSVLVDTEETAEKVAEQARNGADFGELFATYDIQPDEENNGKVSMYQGQLQALFGLPDNLRVGEIYGPIQRSNGYFVLQIMAQETPSAEEVRDLAERIYRSDVQMAYTEARFEEMMKSQTVEKVAENWDSLEKFH
ncbi:MAG: peptidyl-prolyl cis-trans isomerase [Bacillota bacterium]|nr:peptidyl-prolyl cis-trans isomerase [Bacillota bacterium]